MIALALVLLWPPLSARAQSLERPWLAWRTVITKRGLFAVHYPRGLEAWARSVADRLDGVDSAVARVVGFSPPSRVDVVVEDPYDVSNGFAFTFVDRPVIVFWASPPDPRETIGAFRSWGEMLASHEYAHVAHLTRPSRNPFTRTLWRVLPVDLGPIALRAPRWVLEGYATYVEGIVTGSGRPHGVWRPAILRQWAIEGRLPTYDEMSSWGDFDGGEFAYLAGSAFLQWLTERPDAGDSSLVFVWRRLTARRTRTFDEAFEGVFGDSPRTLYGRFSAELIAKAMEAERRLTSDGSASGELVQRLTRATGDPAISADGKRVALVLRSSTRPPRVVVWGTAPEPDTAAARANAELLARDPQDVPARRVYPPSKRVLASLRSKRGRAYEDPRWVPGGERVLLWRPTWRTDGSLRPDLYLWDIAAHSVRRVTHGGGVREADPSPDGRSAAALNCEGGHCDLVTVDLAHGTLRTWAKGDVMSTFSRPRFAPDGRTIAVSMRFGDRWRIALVDSAGATPRVVDPNDGANRYDPTWLDATSLVVVSDGSGAPNLERLTLAVDGASPSVRALTRVSGAAFAPAPNPVDGSIWFLSLQSHGYDLRRLAPDAPPIAASALDALLDTRLLPAVAERGADVPPSPASASGPSKPYGVGPRTVRWAPTLSVAADGRAAGLSLVNSDLVGRLTILAQGSVGNGSAWRGGAVDAMWRGSRPSLRVSLFSALARLTSVETVAGGVASSALLDAGTTGLSGGELRADASRAFDTGDSRVRIAAMFSPSWAQAEEGGAGGSSRTIGVLEAGAAARQTGDRSSLVESVAASITAGSLRSTFARSVASVALRGVTPFLPPVEAGTTYGIVSGGTDPFEQFTVGGAVTSLVDPSLLTQRIAMPALPAGVATGDRLLAYRVAADFGGLLPFYWGASARFGNGRFAQWHRVAGIEFTFDQSAIGVLGTPGARISAGIARSLDEPFARETRGYVSIVLRP